VYGGDCYAYGLLASGHVDLVCEASLGTYDFCALAPVVEGAGGIITDWHGQSLTLASEGRVLAAGDSVLHGKALRVLAA
jgi:inositol-phosphate phosphatase/L-galactose 1-phosphate phosphatase/histidinol-phosphatase